MKVENVKAKTNKCSKVSTRKSAQKYLHERKQYGEKSEEIEQLHDGINVHRKIKELLKTQHTRYNKLADESGNKTIDTEKKHLEKLHRTIVYRSTRQ